LAIAFLVKLYYKTCKKNYQKEFYSYLKVNEDYFSFMNQVFGNRLSMKNVDQFLDMPLAMDLIHECFSKGDNLLLVILNLGDDDDQDEESSFESSSS
jgi:hypothetical protein